MGAFDTFMIMRLTLLWSDWWKISIWNGVMGSQPIRMKSDLDQVCSGQVQDKFRPGLRQVWNRFGTSLGQV